MKVYEFSTGPQVDGGGIDLGSGVKVRPLGRLGRRSMVEIVLDVLPPDMRSSLDGQGIDLPGNADLAEPVVMIELDLPDVQSVEPAEWEEVSRPLFTRTRRALTLAYGEGFAPFAEMAMLDGIGRLSFTLPRARGLVFTTTEDRDLKQVAVDTFKSSATDPRFQFVVSLYDSATRQEDPTIRAAHLFACLEALSAGRFQLDSGQGTRTAVRMMLKYGHGVPFPYFQIGEEDPIEFDHIEAAGRMRDQTFHGLEQIVPGPAAASINFFRNRPEFLAFALSCDCLRILQAGKDTRPDEPQPALPRSSPSGVYRTHFVTEIRRGGHSLCAFVRVESRGVIYFLPGFRDVAGGGLGPFTITVPPGVGPLTREDKIGYTIKVGH